MVEVNGNEENDAHDWVNEWNNKIQLVEQMHRKTMNKS